MSDAAPHPDRPNPSHPDTAVPGPASSGGPGPRRTTSSSPALSVLDLVPVSAGRTRTDALAEMTALARSADAAGYARYWLAEHHGSATFLASATTVLMGQVLAATSRIAVAAGGIMLPNHAPLVVAEQVGTLATLYPGRVGLGLGRAPGTDPITARALRRRDAAPGVFVQEVVETLGYLTASADGATGEGFPPAGAVPGSLASQTPESVPSPLPVLTPAHQVRAVPGEGTEPEVWVLGSSVNGARVAGSLGLPFVVASHFAPAQAEAAVMAYRSTFDPDAPTAQVRRPVAAAAVNAVVAPTQSEAEHLFTTAMAASARIVGGRPGPLDPPTEDPGAWRELAPGKDGLVEGSMALSYVGEAGPVAAQVHDLAARWDLAEVLVVTYVHDAAARRRSYELLGAAW